MAETVAKVGAVPFLQMRQLPGALTNDSLFIEVHASAQRAATPTTPSTEPKRRIASRPKNKKPNPLA